MSNSMSSCPIGITVLLGGLASASSGCDAAPSRSSAVTVRDSAGIEIVESQESQWSTTPGWSISSSPILEIGTLEGDPAYQMHYVSDVTRLPDGRIAVANSGSHQLRLYDPSGAHLQDIGREGEGPGEFQFLFRVWSAGGDSIAAFDNRHGRLSVFDAAGNLGRSVSLERVDTIGSPTAFTGLSDGSILTISGVGSLRPQDGPIDPGTWIYSRYSEEGEFLNKVAEGKEGGRWGTDYRGAYSFPYLPLVLGIPPGGPGADGLILGEGKEFEFEKRRFDGSRVRVVRWNGERRPVTPEVVEQYIDHLTGQTDDPNARRQARAWVEKVPVPDHMPTYSAVQVDALGYAWVEQYRPPWEDTPRWSVFDPEGEWLGELSAPTGFRIDEIGEDYLLGVRRDDLGVERVTMFRLVREDAES